MSDLVQVNIDNSDVLQWLGQLYFTTKQQEKAIMLLEAKIREMGDRIRQLQGI